MRFHLRETRPRRGLTIATLSALVAGLLPLLMAAPAPAADVTAGRAVTNVLTKCDSDTKHSYARWDGQTKVTIDHLAKACIKHFNFNDGTSCQGLTSYQFRVAAQATPARGVETVTRWHQLATWPDDVATDCMFLDPAMTGVHKAQRTFGGKWKIPSLLVDKVAEPRMKVTACACGSSTDRTIADPESIVTMRNVSGTWTFERTIRTVESGPPVLDKPVVTLPNPTSRTAHFALHASDKGGQVTQMRVKATGDTAYRPWVPYPTPDPNTGLSTGTVILPDRYGDFTVWFQVKDDEGNTSSERAADNVTRIQDVTGPTLTGGVSKADPAGRFVSYALSATDDYHAVTQMRVLVSGEDWRTWVPYAPSGTVVLPDGYGRFGMTFQVMDAAGNVSAPLFAGAVTRTAPVSLTLNQIDNLGNVRSCGSTEASACLPVVKKFRTTIDGPIVPNTNLLLKAWRNVNGTWVETTTSPFMLEAIAGRRTVDMTITANLLAGVWRFQAQVPRDGDVSEFAASGYQYLRFS
jgi:hypothetical protein